MKEKFKKFLENGRGVILALFILELALTIFVTPNKFDDKTFIDNIASNSIISYVGPRYFWWTSRTIIEFTLCLVLKTSKYLWILLEALMVTLAGYSISKLFIKDNKKENNIILLFMILVYPLDVMNSAGWAATTTNYMWPLALGLFSLIPIRKIWDGEKIKFWQYPLYTLALLYACNQEQTCAIIVCLYLLFTVITTIRDKKLHPYLLIQTLFTIASLIFILTCPGNYERQASEISENFKDIGMLSTLDKLGLGFTANFSEVFTKGDLVFLMFTGLIYVYIMTNYKDKLYRVVAAIPFLSILVSHYFRRLTEKFFPFINLFFDEFGTKDVKLTAANCNNLFNVLPIVFSLGITICIVLSLLLIFKKLKNNVALLIFLAGLASRVMMGFSPTVFVSGERTRIYFDFAMIIASLLVWLEFKKNTEKIDIRSINRTEKAIQLAGVFQYINVLVCILLTQK